jgi:hypothetical protein
MVLIERSQKVAGRDTLYERLYLQSPRTHGYGSSDGAKLRQPMRPHIIADKKTKKAAI